MEALPGDVLVEIFARVGDAVALFRCAATCKRWRSLAGDWPKDVRHPSSLIGFFEDRPSLGEAFFTCPPPVLPPFLPAPQSPLGPRRGFLVVSIPEAGSSMDRAMPLASRRGLVLVRLGPQAWPPTMGCTAQQLAICNPLAGTSQLLPPLERGRFFNNERCCCAILTGADYSAGSSTFFKVLIVNVDQSSRHIYLRTFSSTERSWSAPRKHDNPVGWMQLRQCGGVVCRGMAHWLFRDLTMDLCILDVSAETGRVSSTKIPLPLCQIFVLQPYDEPRLGATTDGRVSLNFLHRACLRVEIWIRQGYYEDTAGGGTAEWLQACVIELRQPEKKRIDNPRCMCVGERTGTLLIKDSRGNMYVADLQTGIVEEVTARLCDPVTTAIPLEIDWPGFLVPRLAGSSKWSKTGEAVLRFASTSFGE